MCEWEPVFGSSDKTLSSLDKTFSVTDKGLSDPKKTFSGLDKTMTETDKALSGSDKTSSMTDKTFSEADKVLAALKKVFSTTDKSSSGLEKTFSAMDKGLFDSDKTSSETDKFSSGMAADAGKTKKAAVTGSLGKICCESGAATAALRLFAPNTFGAALLRSCAPALLRSCAPALLRSCAVATGHHARLLFLASPVVNLTRQWSKNNMRKELKTGRASAFPMQARQSLAPPWFLPLIAAPLPTAH